MPRTRRTAHALPCPGLTTCVRSQLPVRGWSGAASAWEVWEGLQRSGSTDWVLEGVPGSDLHPTEESEGPAGWGT